MLNENFKDILNALAVTGADYLVVGAYAMAAHGCPRATADIDIWVRPTEANAARVWAALQAFRAPLSKVTQVDFHTPDVVYQIGVAPQRIDILTSISGVEFDHAWPDRLVVVIDGLGIPVIGLKQLYANKLASARQGPARCEADQGPHRITTRSGGAEYAGGSLRSEEPSFCCRSARPIVTLPPRTRSRHAPGPRPFLLSMLHRPSWSVCRGGHGRWPKWRATIPYPEVYHDPAQYTSYVEFEL